MADLIETYGDKAAFVSAREHAWHKLGTVTDDAMTAEDAMEKAHLAGWKVRTEPMMVHLPDGRVLQTGNAYGVVRDNPFIDGQVDYLGPVGGSYTPIQNEEHAELLNALVDESGAHFETAGSLREGKEVFVTMKLPQHMMIGDIDPVEVYLAGCNRHDGRGAFKLITTPVRIVCANTQAAAIANAYSSFSVRHTKNYAQAMQVAREALGLTFKYIDGFQEEAEKMIQESITDAEFDKIIDRVFGKVEPEKQATASANKMLQTHADLMGLFHDSDTLQNIKGTRWGAYQAVTEYVDFFAPVRTKGDQQFARATRALGEKGIEVKTKAFQLLSV
ncbi:hypothetical protein SEA_SONALI_94 [Arthrobacter phage Sonali]|uniref:DUF945 domain-containing protein n=1 Tax=Arthrobacter phage Sonali TaxID=2510495 RepID=A0A411CQX4_9CAUD|nr:hypothetical protein HOV09_gp94 [Arthrobacter phage Sonali]QAY16206.1 hypothetical protein SEA_SONALI_94 [Arthrobacter phage Sonali]